MVKCIKCVNSALLSTNRIYCSQLRTILRDEIAEADIPCNYYMEWRTKENEHE